MEMSSVLALADLKIAFQRLRRSSFRPTAVSVSSLSLNCAAQDTHPSHCKFTHIQDHPGNKEQDTSENVMDRTRVAADII